MEDALRLALDTNILEKTGYTASGGFNEGLAYVTDIGELYVKRSEVTQAKEMFEAEFASLRAIELTSTVRVPHPVKVVDGPGSWKYNVMEFIKLNDLQRFQGALGSRLADMHLHNERISKNGRGYMNYVNQFGFHRSTFIGFTELDNSWNNDWLSFFCQNRIDTQVRAVLQQKGSRIAIELWSHLQRIVPRFFNNIIVKPSLIHGELWYAKASQTKAQPVLLDPSCLYGHHEFDLATTTLHGGGFDENFYKAYHTLIPREPGFTARRKFYQLFHMLAYWAQYGCTFEASSIGLMKDLLRTKFPLVD